jgi:hypothetical protein
LPLETSYKKGKIKLTKGIAIPRTELNLRIKNRRERELDAVCKPPAARRKPKAFTKHPRIQKSSRFPEPGFARFILEPYRGPVLSCAMIQILIMALFIL